MTPEEFLQLLNDGQVRNMCRRPVQDRERLQRADELRMRSIRAARDFQLRSAVRHSEGSNPIEADLARAPDMFYEHLYSLVGKWILSGHDEGFDQPRRRTLEEHPSIRQALAQWRSINRDVAGVALTGEEVRHAGIFQANNGFSLDSDPIAKVRHEAIGYFHWLMNSGDFRYRLNRCADCHGFYERKKLRPSYVFLREPTGLMKLPGYQTVSGFCQECLKSASTTNSVRAGRFESRDPILKAASKALQQYSSLSQKRREVYGTKTAYIVKKLAKYQLKYPEKWVARNLAVIQKRAV